MNGKPIESLEQRIRSNFDQLGYKQLNSIECTTQGDRIKLTGQLDSFYLKQVAQSVAMKVGRGRFIQNEIDVT